jgi:hypothetical protein
LSWQSPLLINNSLAIHTCNTSDTVNDVVNHLLANGVMATGVVVSGILFSADQELRVEELAITTGSDLVDGRRVQVDEEGAGHVFTAAGFGEEGFEGAAIEDILRVWVGSTIGSEAVLKEVPGEALLNLGSLISRVGMAPEEQ